MTMLEQLDGISTQRNDADEQIINSAAIQSARGEDPKTERELAAIADALHRLGKDQSYLAEKIDIVRRHDAAEKAEAAHHEQAAQAKQFLAEYKVIEKEAEPIIDRLRSAGDRANAAAQSLFVTRASIGKAAEIRARHPKLFPQQDAK